MWLLIFILYFAIGTLTLAVLARVAPRYVRHDENVYLVVIMAWIIILPCVIVFRICDVLIWIGKKVVP